MPLMWTLERNAVRMYMQEITFVFHRRYVRCESSFLKSAYFDMLAGVDCTSASPHLIYGVEVGDARFHHGQYRADLGRNATTMPVSPACLSCL
jgi:hypothetical protein